MAKKLIHRIKEYVDYKNLPMRQFDMSIGASDGYLQRTVKNNGNVGSKLIGNIIEVYTELNPYWLITGKGEMLNQSENKKVNSADFKELSDARQEIIDLKTEKIAAQGKKIEELKLAIKELKKELEQADDSHNVAEHKSKLK